MSDRFERMMIRLRVYEEQFASRFESDSERELLFDSELQRLGHEVRNIEFAINEERSKGTLTAAGVAARARELGAPVLKTLERLEANRLKAREEATAMRTRAAKGLEPSGTGGWVEKKPTPPTAEQLVEEREVRDILRAQLSSGELKPYELTVRYHNAVRDGSDPAFVGAIERAPKAFPLVDLETRAAADAIRIDQSPLAPMIGRLEAAVPFHEAITAGAREELAGMGITVDDDMLGRLQADAAARGRQ